MASKANQKPEGLFAIEGITFMVFNKDFTKVAISKKDKYIYIYGIKDFMKPDTWTLDATLKAHMAYVSDLDWNANSNDILSCSHDKTMFVWECTDKAKNIWSSSNVVASTKLGFLCCKWNDRGDKFCAGTSSKNLYIGYYNGSTNWWMTKNIKAHHSSVCSCVIDPSSLYVISGSTDLRVSVSSCYLPDVDDNKISAEVKAATPKFGEVLYEVKVNTWVLNVNWNKAGTLGFATNQNSTVAVVNYKEKTNEIIKLEHTPLLKIIPNGDNGFYGVGYDRNIYEYAKTGDKWEMKRKITETGKVEVKKGPVGGTVANAMKKFQAQGSQKKEDLVVKTKQNPKLHNALISAMNIKGNDVITSDVTGFIKYWKL